LALQACDLFPFCLTGWQGGAGQQVGAAIVVGANPTMCCAGCRRVVCCCFCCHFIVAVNQAQTSVWSKTVQRCWRPWKPKGPWWGGTCRLRPGPYGAHGLKWALQHAALVSMLFNGALCECSRCVVVGPGTCPGPTGTGPSMLSCVQHPLSMRHQPGQHWSTRLACICSQPASLWPEGSVEGKHSYRLLGSAAAVACGSCIQGGVVCSHGAHPLAWHHVRVAGCAGVLQVCCALQVGGGTVE
jgi:hypothetical protein